MYVKTIASISFLFHYITVWFILGRESWFVSVGMVSEIVVAIVVVVVLVEPTVSNSDDALDVVAVVVVEDMVPMAMEHSLWVRATVDTWTAVESVNVGHTGHSTMTKLVSHSTAQIPVPLMQGRAMENRAWHMGEEPVGVVEKRILHWHRPCVVEMVVEASMTDRALDAVVGKEHAWDRASSREGDMPGTADCKHEEGREEA